MAAKTPARRPNIIIILCDDMGFSDLGCYGSEIHTPNLDKLATDGVRFTEFYNTARCCPSRASLLTGLYPHQAGVGHMTDAHHYKSDISDGYVGDLNPHCLTIAQVLKGTGYATYMTGKWHVCKDDKPNSPKYNWPMQRGFDRYYGTIVGAGSFFDPGMLCRDNTPISPFADTEYHPPAGEPYYYTNAISDQAARFITDHHQQHPDQPFFSYVAFTAAHWPMQALPRDIEKYKGVYDVGYEPIRQARFQREKDLGLIDPKWRLSPQCGDWDAIQKKAWEARCMEVYAAQIDCMDQGVGRIVQALKQTGQFDDTLILFLQDNGANLEHIGRQISDRDRPSAPTLKPLGPDFIETAVVPNRTRDGWPMMMGQGVMPGPADTYIAVGQDWANVSNTPFREYKHFVHEGGIASPLIAHWPAGIGRHDAVENQPCHLIDLMATCVDLSGAAYPKTYHGNDITPLEGASLDGAFNGRPIARNGGIYWEHEGNRAAREGDMKLVAKNAGGDWELYDMRVDRTEMHNLAPERPDVVRKMAADWEAWGKRVGALPWPWSPPYTAPADRPAPTVRSLKQGDRLSADQSPQLVGRELTLHVSITRLNGDGPGDGAGDGVILCQGGDKDGYELRIQGGRPVFSVRRGGKLRQIAGHDSLKAPASIDAQLTLNGALSLTVNGELAATNVAASHLINGGVTDEGPFAEQPTAGLCAGCAPESPIADESPSAFTGAMDEITVTTRPGP